MAIARQAMKDARIRKKVVELMGKVLSKELTLLSYISKNFQITHARLLTGKT